MKKYLRFLIVVLTALSVLPKGNIPGTEPRETEHTEHTFVMQINGATDDNLIYHEGEAAYLTGLTAELCCTECGYTEPLDGKLKADGTMVRGQESMTLTCGDYQTDVPITVKPVYRISFIGDSLTDGAGYRKEYQYTTYVKKKLKRDVNCSNFGLSGVSVTGYGGLFGDDVIGYVDQQIYKDCIATEADMVIIMLGTNDAEDWGRAADCFKDRYLDLIAALERDVPGTQIVLSTTPPSIDGNKFGVQNDVLKEINLIVREIAEEKELPLIEMYDLVTARGHLDDGFFLDGLHFSREALPLISDIMINKICEFYNIQK